MRPRRTRAKGYIEDLLDCCERIARYTAGVSRQTFLSESMMQDATIRNLEIMGEASRQFVTFYPQLTIVSHPFHSRGCTRCVTSLLMDTSP
jgi:uncharacterized protein with HEPN domain